MARMLGSTPQYGLCPFGCCTRWGPNRKTKYKLKRVNKSRERREARKEIRDES